MVKFINTEQKWLRHVRPLIPFATFVGPKILEFSYGTKKKLCTASFYYTQVTSLLIFDSKTSSISSIFNKINYRSN